MNYITSVIQAYTDVTVRTNVSAERVRESDYDLVCVHLYGMCSFKWYLLDTKRSSKVTCELFKWIIMHFKPGK